MKIWKELRVIAEGAVASTVFYNGYVTIAV